MIGQEIFSKYQSPNFFIPCFSDNYYKSFNLKLKEEKVFLSNSVPKTIGFPRMYKEKNEKRELKN